MHHNVKPENLQCIHYTSVVVSFFSTNFEKQSFFTVVILACPIPKIAKYAFEQT